jgi:glyoxylase-like metal-dependent hydrolase (beta-lactamase superfamily II)
VHKENYTVEKILETHAHADYFTTSYYMKQQLSNHPEICIGARISAVQNTWAEKYGVEKFEYEGVFHKLFEYDEIFAMGNIQAKVVHLPGHTPDHVGYLIDSNIFTGDSIFNPDIESARCDFPGGSPTDLLLISRNYFRYLASIGCIPGTTILMDVKRCRTLLSQCSKRRTNTSRLGRKRRIL